MNEHEIAIVKYLMNKETWVASHKIANYLGISIRTLRSRVKNINSHYTLISSSNKGYKIEESIKNNLKKQNNNETFYSINTREKYILKLLLLSEESINFYDLAERLYVSESTLSKDLSIIRKKIGYRNLSVVQKNGSLKIEGEENKVRMLISDLIYQEAKDGLFNLNVLDKIFPDYKVLELKKIVIEEITNFDLETNDYNLINIILHFCILFERTKYSNKNYLNHNQENNEKTIIKSKQMKVVDVILRRFLKITSFPFHIKELDPYYSIIQLYTREKSLFQSQIEVSEIFNQEIVIFCKKMIEEVRKIFYVDLNSDNFLVSFSYHLEQLVKFQRNSFKNPLYKNIKNNYPAIFEIAVYIAKLIHDHWNNIILDEHEISYIAIHVGMILENKANSKIKVVIVNPDYYNLSQIIVDKIMMIFGNDIDIIKIFSNESDILDCDFDLILSTTKLTKKENYLFFGQISIFVNQNDVEKIRRCIQLVLEYKFNKKNMQLINLIDSNLFIYFENSQLLEEDIIRELSNKLIELNIEDENYLKNVLKREKTSSTSYYNIAIPHSFELNANQTKICIGLLKKPIKWGNNIVNIVFLITVSKKDKMVFIDLIKSLIKLFTCNEWNENYSKVKSYDDLLEYIKSMI